MALLFSIGEGNDDVSVISDLLDITKTPSKPGYRMADPEPLSFSHCEYRPCPFQKLPSQIPMCSPGTVASEAFEASMVQVCQQRAIIEETIGDGVSYFADRKAKTAGRSIMSIQKGKTIEEKVKTLKGNKKKRYENVQDWKERMLEKEGELRGRSRSRSLEKEDNLDD